MNNKVLAIIAAIIVVAAGVGLYIATGDRNNGGDSPSGGDTVTDALGREVIIPDNLDNGIVVLGSSGPLRFISMFDVFKHIIEIDKGDITDSKNGRGYSYAYPYDTFDVETQSHADNALDASTAEKIGNKNPSLIVTVAGVWNKDLSNFESLSKKCTILVLFAPNMKTMTEEDGTVAKYISDNITMLGKVFKQESRATELIKGLNSTLDDIKSLSGDAKKSVYVAGVTISGSNSLDTTFPKYMPFDITGVTNAYNGTSTENKVVLNVETITKMKMDMIVIDPSSSDQINGNEASQHVLEYIYGINNDADKTNDIPLYITVPIVWDHINYDGVLASSYCLDYLVYGTLTLDQLKEKINNIFTLFYGEHGKNVFADMSEFFDGKSAANGQGMPLLSEVVIVKNASGYALKAA